MTSIQRALRCQAHAEWHNFACKAATVTPCTLDGSFRSYSTQKRMPARVSVRTDVPGREATRLPHLMRFCFSLRGGSLNRRAAVPPRILCFAFSDRNGISQVVDGRSKSQSDSRRRRGASSRRPSSRTCTRAPCSSGSRSVATSNTCRACTRSGLFLSVGASATCSLASAGRTRHLPWGYFVSEAMT